MLDLCFKLFLFIKKKKAFERDLHSLFLAKLNISRVKAALKHFQGFYAFTGVFMDRIINYFNPIIGGKRNIYRLCKGEKLHKSRRGKEP